MRQRDMDSSSSWTALTAQSTTASTFELGYELKEKSARGRVEQSKHGQKPDTDRVTARIRIAMAQRGQRAHGSGLCLRTKSLSFTFTLNPRKIDLVRAPICT
jgi:hypothetical protein